MNIEDKLIQLCMEGDRRSQQRLYNESFSTLMGVAYRYVQNREDAASLVNQSYLKILQALPAFSGANSSASYFVWIKKIMMNTIIDEFRKKKLKEVQVIEDERFLEQLCEEDYNEIEEQIAQEELFHMLQALSEMQRKVFNLYAIDGYSHKEICEMLHIGLSNSKWHLSQARRKLQDMLSSFVKNKNIGHHVE